MKPPMFSLKLKRRRLVSYNFIEYNFFYVTFFHNIADVMDDDLVSLLLLSKITSAVPAVGKGKNITEEKSIEKVTEENGMKKATEEKA